MSSTGPKLVFEDYEVLRALPRVDSDSSYVRITELAERAFQAVCEQGWLPIVPAVQRRQVAPCQMSEFGSSPRSLLHSLGLFDLVVEHVLSCLKPWCSTCQLEATAPGTLREIEFPEEGIVALAIPGDSDEFSLRERCELFGVERAIVNGLLVRVSDLSEQPGEPILVASLASDRDMLDDEVARWFSRGGGPLRVLHFVSREASARFLALLQGAWCCAGCSTTFDKPARSTLLEAARCPTCKGQGWFEVASDLPGTRQRMCTVCSGAGVHSPFLSYRYSGVPFSQVPLLSFCAFSELVSQRQDSLALELQSYLKPLSSSIFAEYPLGTPVDLLSPGEQALLTIAIAEQARIQDVQYLLDGSFGPFADSESLKALAGGRIAVMTPPLSVCAKQQVVLSGESRGVVRVRDICQGPLRIPDLSFSIGSLTAIQGDAGSGKTLLLEGIVARFSKRRKLAHLGSFGALQRCTLLTGCSAESGSVLELVGLAGDLAREIARTRRAQEVGLVSKELELPRSKDRCHQCNGRGGDSENTLCQVCFGALYDWRVASLPLFDRTVSEVMQTPLGKLAALLWAEDHVGAVLAAVAQGVGEGVCLGTPATQLDPSTRRFLVIAGGLARFGAASVGQRPALSLAKELILIDGPCALPRAHSRVIENLLVLLQEQGATVVYASMPESLEMLAQSVLRLEAKKMTAEQRAREEYLDTRYGRMTEVVVSR